MVLEGIVGSDVVDLVLMGAPAEVVVHDWYEYSRILAAFCQFLLAWLLLCSWLRPIGLLGSERFVEQPTVWRGYLSAFSRPGAGDSGR